MKVGIYPRVSTQEQAKEGYSIREQTERLTKYCEAMGWKVFKCYTEPGHSGANMNRPGLQEMISDIKEGKIDKVVVWKLDRLSRSQKDTLELIEDVFLKNNVDFESMTERLDTSTPHGRAMIGILAAFAQLEREQIKERMSIGKEGRAKEGKWHGGSTCPIGYSYVPEDDMLYVDEYEKMQILELYELFLKGTPLKRIEAIFYEKGYVHKHGHWSPKIMKRVMANPLYIGYLRWEGNLYKGLHQPIIDDETFETAVKILDERAENWKNAHKKQRHGIHSTALGGMVRCAYCGAKYSVCIDRRDKNGIPVKKYGCYSRHKKIRSMIVDPTCKNKYWKVAKLEDLVFSEIRNLALEPNAIRDIQGETISGIPEKIKLMQKEIDKLKAQKSKYMELFSLDEITMDEIQEKSSVINEKVSKLSAEIVELQKYTAKLSEDETRKLVESFDEILERGDLDEIRLLMETLIDYIEIDNDDVTIYWNFV